MGIGSSLTMRINDHLLKQYNAHWTTLVSELHSLSKDQYTNPFLLAFDEEKLNASDMRVMIFGQETKGWGNTIDLMEGPTKIAGNYHHFFCDKNFYKGYGRSSFWKAFRFFEQNIQAAYPEKNIYFSWNNINKIGRSGGKTNVSGAVRALEREHLSVVAAEVAAFKPDLVIFLTGPNRNSDFKHHFPDVTFSAIDNDYSVKALAHVKSAALPSKAIRLYHPSYFKAFTNEYKALALAALFKEY
jgi:hypothetical protein